MGISTGQRIQTGRLAQSGDSLLPIVEAVAALGYRLARTDRVRGTNGEELPEFIDVLADALEPLEGTVERSGTRLEG